MIITWCQPRFFAMNCKTNSSSATRASNFTYLFINSGIEFNTSITQMWCLTSTIIHSQAFGWSIVHRILSSADVCARSSWRNHCLCLQCRAISCTLTQRFCSTVCSTAWPPVHHTAEQRRKCPDNHVLACITSPNIHRFEKSFHWQTEQ